MKKLIAFLMFIFPTFCFGNNDACTTPNEHIIDKRCYVTRGEITEYPYNTIVRIGNVATGTIIGPNTILTCRSCVNPERYSTNHGDIEFYTSDKERHVGKVVVMPTEQNTMSEWAVMKTEDTFDGPFMEVADSTKDLGVSQIGYSALKILSDAEVGIVKSEYSKIVKKYAGKTITPERVNRLISELENRLEKRACKASSDKSCMSCATSTKCIFLDFNNMKKQAGCAIIHGQPRYLQTSCYAGDMGSPLIVKDNKEIIGITFTQNAFFMDGMGLPMATRPEFYHKEVNRYLKSSMARQHD